MKTIRFDLLHFQVVKLIVLLVLAMFSVVSVIIFQLGVTDVETATKMIMSGVALTLVYLFFFSRYKVVGRVLFYEDKIDVVSNEDNNLACFQIKNLRFIKMKLNGVYQCETPFDEFFIIFQRNHSRKAISKLHIQTVSGEKISFSMRARSMNYVLAEQILEGYKAAGVEVKYVIFKNT